MTISSRFATTSLTWNIPSGSSSSVWVDSKQNTLRLGTSIMAERSSRSWPSGRECVAKQVGQRDMSRQIPYKATLARPLCRNNQSTPICDDISLDERQTDEKTDGTNKRVFRAVSATPYRKRANKNREKYRRIIMRGFSAHVLSQIRDSPRSACQTSACV